MTATLLRGGCVLALGSRTPNFPEADVLIRDGVIVEVGQGLRARDAEVVDASHTVVMPGFVDAHRHVGRSLFANLARLGGSDDDLRAALTPDDVYAATFIGLLGSIEAGTTTVLDWADLPNGRTFLEASLSAHADAGIRTVFATDQMNPPGELPPTTTVVYASHRPLTDGEGVAADWATARAAGRTIHTHAGTTADDAGSVADLGRRGALGNDVTLVHCTHLGAGDLDAARDAGANVVLTPSTEMIFGIGAPPIQELLDRKIAPGLGVDDDRESPADVFAQMRATISLQHATYFDRKLAGKGGLPNVMTTRDVIRHATVDGARAAGLEGVVGSLEPGMRADVIVFRTDLPNITPVNDPIGAVVWGMDTSNLDKVYVDGTLRYDRGAVVADVEAARDLAAQAQHRVAAAAGLVAGTRDHA